MKMGRSLDPAFDLPVFMMSHHSFNFSNVGKTISSKDGFLLFAVAGVRHSRYYT